MAVALAIGLRRGEALGLRWINADPVNGWLLRRFRAWERTQVARANKLSLVFTTRNGTPLEPRNVNRALEALCRRANVRSIRLHDLWHSRGTLLFAMGVEAATVQRILRRSSISVTTGTYVSVIEQVQRAAVDGRDRARSAPAGRDSPFVRPTNGLITGHNKRGCAESVSTWNWRGVMTMGTASFADMGYDDRDYDNWLTTLTEASARLDVLQTAVTERCRVCASQDVHSDQVLDVLEKHGAITKAVRARCSTAA